MNSYNKLLGAICLFLLLCTTAQAQRLDTPWALKISLGNIAVQNQEIQSSEGAGAWGSLYNGLTVDFIKHTKNGNSHSFGLANLGFGWSGRSRDQFGKKTGGFSFQGGLRYEYTWNILKGPEPKKWEPYLGVGAFIGTSYEPGILLADGSNPVDLEFVASKTWRLYGGAELIPGVRWNITDRIFLDFSLPIQYMPRVHSTTRFNQMDGFTGRNSFTSDNFSSLRMGLRIGIGFRLGK